MLIVFFLKLVLQSNVLCISRFLEVEFYFLECNCKHLTYVNLNTAVLVIDTKYTTHLPELQTGMETRGRDAHGTVCARISVF